MTPKLYATIGVLFAGCTALTDFDRFHYGAESDAAYDPEDAGELWDAAGDGPPDAAQDAAEAVPDAATDAGPLPVHDAGHTPTHEEEVAAALSGTWHMVLTWSATGTCSFGPVATLKPTWVVTANGSTVSVTDGTSTWAGTQTFAGFKLPALKLEVMLAEMGKISGTGTWPGETPVCTAGVPRKVEGSK